MTDHCLPTLFSRTPPHRFEACYDRSEPVLSTGLWGGIESGPVDAFVKRETYVRHVCTRCGQTVEREATG